MKKIYPCLFLFACFLFSYSCKKKAGELVPDNDAPYYDGVPTILVQNYVNRLFIDLIGREPLDVEMDAEVKRLQDKSLDASSRISLIRKLQSDDAYLPGDSSYKYAYYNRFYESCKVKLIEAASNQYINGEISNYRSEAVKDSIAGDTASYNKNMLQVKILKEIIDCERQYRQDSIDIRVIFRRMMLNSIYDFINMNTFNFVNATFDDLFYRFPTQSEFTKAFAMVDGNPQKIFGKNGQSKSEYVDILINTNEFYEGIIRWIYKSLLAREPNSYETFSAMQTFSVNLDIQALQVRVMQSDEYANF